ncbi:sodium- and chloride-dependent GABA transporter ine-like [Pomacea canaliculata]|uniref:sodium- and chloride-dependent GABA transporter ine-like n=1 Tax=Pomacea canaliculata TaxID=400727 RepID=UPI000D730952|nr:sodium- and chloride-dependent GABA transporter ine-like [Pomacea canaliculata]XP_025082544.1 sodium- and chloride-dependent GABA transporter ine-like [Pomacea canaliculata]XP_025082545.1 sodium- and chloride-dependent GABA transporter ine-like [Pomacea canaliculata]
MSHDIPPWNPLQFVMICMFTTFSTFFLPPESGLSLVAVFVSLLILCIPALFVQLKIGGYLQKGIVGSFSMFFPIWKGVGIAALLDLLLRISSLAPVVAQIGTYAFIAISDHPFVWGYCNELKIPTAAECIDDNQPQSMPVFREGAYRVEQLFYEYEFLQKSPGPSHINGFPQWHFTEIARKAEVSLMPVTLAIVWVMVFLLVGFGGRVCGWILFLLGPAALSCLLAVTGYGYAHLNMDDTLAFLQKHYRVSFDDSNQVLENWTKGFQLVMYSIPAWSAIAATMGKMCGRGRKIRNIGWLLLVMVYALISQLPPIAMAPYISNMLKKNAYVSYSVGPGLILWQMPAAFTALNIPSAYAFIFFLSAFLFSLMFLCVGCLTIVDNVVEALAGWIERKACSKVAVHLLITFIVMCVAKALGIIHTTRAGYYYSMLFDSSMYQLRFIIIMLMALGFLVVYVKQNFALLERVLMAFWFGSSALTCASLWFYTFINDYDRLFIHTSDKNTTFSAEWDVLRWVIAAFPFIGIPIGALHACFVACGEGSPVCVKLWCGITERVREHNFDQLPPPPPPEPTAPPYMYTYMDSAYPLDDVTYKMEYDPPETAITSTQQLYTYLKLENCQASI